MVLFTNRNEANSLCFREPFPSLTKRFFTSCEQRQPRRKTGKTAANRMPTTSSSSSFPTREEVHKSLTKWSAQIQSKCVRKRRKSKQQERAVRQRLGRAAHAVSKSQRSSRCSRPLEKRRKKQYDRPRRN